MTEKSLTLFIDRSSSECGNCGRGAAPHEEGHHTVLSWFASDASGCGVRWRFVSSHYVGMKDTVMAMRPDLEWRDDLDLVDVARSGEDRGGVKGLG